MPIKPRDVPILPVRKKERYDPFRNACILDILVFCIVIFCSVSLRLWEMHYRSYRRLNILCA